MTKITKELEEQGTKAAGYAEDGPYHCLNCVHKVHENVPICIHPAIIEDPQLRERRCDTTHPATGRCIVGVFIKLETGCCRYVKPREE